MSSQLHDDEIALWEKAPDHIRELAVEETARRYEAQIELMLAADQRALAIAGLGAAMTAVGLGAVFSANAELEFWLKMLVLGVGCTAGFGTFLCWWSARPIDVYPKGWTLSDFKNNLDAGSTNQRMQAEICYWADVRIEKNNELMKKNSRSFSLGSALILFAPVLGFVIAVCLN